MHSFLLATSKFESVVDDGGDDDDHWSCREKKTLSTDTFSSPASPARNLALTMPYIRTHNFGV